MRVLSKTLVAFGIISFFTLGIVSVSFAARVPSASGPLHYGKFHGPFKHKIPQMDKKNLKTGMLFEEDGELPKPSQGQRPAEGMETIPLQIRQTIYIFQIALAPKVSALIFQSVLNL